MGKITIKLLIFSGKRCVAIIAGLVSIVVSAVLLFVWPLLFGALVALGDAVAGMGIVGAGIYAFLNRLLIPTGLHHALNNVFWFDTIGLGDLQHFWAGETSADVTWSLGMYMSGFFPCMMFGIPGAALAMIQCAKPAKKKVQLASDDYTEIAKKILAGCGGKGNIVSIDNCVTRLRLEVRDMTAVNDKAIKAAGVAGVIKPGKTSVQIIVGTKVQFVADAFSKLCE